MIAPALPSLLRPSQLAELLHVSARTVRKWVEDGHLPRQAVIRTGKSKTAKRIRISVQRLRDAGWLLSETTPAATSATMNNPTPGLQTEVRP